jgi:uncharacterized protein
MDFEFDPAKSAANLEKHGIDFVRAQALWIRIISVRRARHDEKAAYFQD